jgi:hypothetical protein
MSKIIFTFTLLAAIVLAQWQVANSGSYPERVGSTGVFIDGKVFAFGGYREDQDYTHASQTFSNDVLVWNTDQDTPSWSSPLTTTGTAPTARTNHVAVYRHHSSSKQLIVGLGGTFSPAFTPLSSPTDFFALNIKTNQWSQIVQDYSNIGGSFPFFKFASFCSCNMNSNAGASAWYDKHSDSMYIFGGINLYTYGTYSSTFKLVFSTTNGVLKATWYAVSSTLIPHKRDSPSVVFDEEARAAYIYGGEYVDFSVNPPAFPIPSDIQWSFNVASGQWTQVSPSNAPTPRNNGNGWADAGNGQFLLYGGDIGGGSTCGNVFYAQNCVTDSYLFTPSSNSWSLVAPGTVTPPALKRGTLVSIDDCQTLLYGGWYQSCPTGIVFNRNTYVFSNPTCGRKRTN